MGADADSVEFAAALQALGATYMAAADQHGVSRELFSAAQSLAAVTTVVRARAVINRVLVGVSRCGRR